MFNFFKKKPPKESGRLIGSKLIDRVKEFNHLSKTEIAITCGYYRMADGKPYPLFTEFYTAILVAKDIELEKSPCKLSYRATVQGNGNLLIGTAYTSMMDLHPGDQFEIQLGTTGIRLVRAGTMEI